MIHSRTNKKLFLGFGQRISLWILFSLLLTLLLTTTRNVRTGNQKYYQVEGLVVMNTATKFQITWEANVEQIIREKLKQTEAIVKQPGKQQQQQQQPYMVAIVGIPGSGKTTGSTVLANEMLKDLGALHMPFDGYHIPLSDLMKQQQEAQEQQQQQEAGDGGITKGSDLVYRRGAPDTFDAGALYRDLQRIRYDPENESIISLPNFCHAKGDPEYDNTIVFRRNQHRVIICEGLYLLHNDIQWEQIKECFDYTVYVDANVNDCMERLKIRNQKIPGYTPEEINIRVDAVDRVNAGYVEQSKTRADMIVKSYLS